jgi:hypothetical protein
VIISFSIGAFFCQKNKTPRNESTCQPLLRQPPHAAVTDFDGVSFHIRRVKDSHPAASAGVFDTMAFLLHVPWILAKHVESVHSSLVN